MVIDKTIDNGIQFLDNTLGIGWENDIDLDTLVIMSPCQCVCGQLFEVMADRNGLSNGFAYVLDTYSDDNNWIAEHGFVSSTDAWKEAIISLRNANRIDTSSSCPVGTVVREKEMV